MSCVKRKLVVLVAVFFLACAPRVSFATSTCDCFCGKAGSGATLEGTSMQQSTCSDRCDDKEKEFIGCFSDPSQYPVESDVCWTKEECSQWSDDRNGETISATWGSVFPAECSVTKTSGEEMRHCYSEDVPYDLNIAIGNVGTVQNLPEYINLVYTWLLPAASLIAVVMMMIAGLQYTLARGKPKYIDKAKTRITNAITGVVILMSAYVILNLIDPRLVTFDALKIPLVKKVVMLDPTSSCDRLQDYGYTIDPTEELGDSAYKVCGGHGVIQSDDGLQDNALGSWKEGDSCEYTACQEGESCVADGGENTCRSCADTPKETASPTACALIEAFEDETGMQMYCEYNAELKSCTTAGFGLGFSQGYSCRSLRTSAQAKVDNSESQAGCNVYNELEFGYNALIGTTTEDITEESGAALLERICTEDLCKIGDLLTTDPDAPLGCVYDSMAGCKTMLK